MVAGPDKQRGPRPFSGSSWKKESETVVSGHSELTSSTPSVANRKPPPKGTERTKFHPTSPIPNQLLMKKAVRFPSVSEGHNVIPSGKSTDRSVTGRPKPNHHTFALTEIEHCGPLGAHLPTSSRTTRKPPDSYTVQGVSPLADQENEACRQRAVSSHHHHRTRRPLLFPVERTQLLSIDSQFAPLVAPPASRTRTEVGIWSMDRMSPAAGRHLPQDVTDAAVQKLQDEFTEMKQLEAQLRCEAATKEAAFHRLLKQQRRERMLMRAQSVYQARRSQGRTLRTTLREAVAEGKQCQELEHLAKCERRKSEKERREEHLHRLELEFVERHRKVRQARRTEEERWDQYRTMQEAYVTDFRNQAKEERDVRHGSSAAHRQSHLASLRSYAEAQQSQRRESEETLKKLYAQETNARRARCEAIATECREELDAAAVRCFAEKRRQHQSVVKGLLSLRKAQIANLTTNMLKTEEAIQYCKNTTMLKGW